MSSSSPSPSPSFLRPTPSVETGLTQDSFQPQEYVTSTIIAASAGTGKTYQLSLRFISLLALGVPPEEMIALTFTRKAAGEFCDRILRDLAEGAASLEGAAVLANRIRDTWYGTTSGIPLCKHASEARHPLTRMRFQQLLRRVIESLEHIKLSTLDSFFYSLLSTNALDLGLSSLSMMTAGQERELIRQTQETLFCDISGDDRKLADFLRLFRSFVGQYKNDLQKAYNEIIHNYSNLFWKAPRMELWCNHEAFGADCYLDREPLNWAVYRRAATFMKDAYDPNVKVTRFPGKALLNFPAKMQTRNFKDIKTVCTAIRETPKGATPAMIEMLRLAEFLMEETRKDIMRETQQRTLAAYKLLEQYQQHYQALVRNSGKFVFDDVTRHIPALLEKEGAPTRLAYRLDSKIHHWMLDEFQDTNVSQWKALLPLISEILADIGNSPDGTAQRSLFIVGDNKQSIYGWRGGTPKLFESLLHAPGLQPMEMVTSWRSSQVILDFVNSAFGYCGQALEHKAAKPDLSGCVEVHRYTKSDGNHEHLFNSIAAILHSLPIGKKQMSIGILVRSNALVVETARWLQQHTHYSVNTLSDEPIGTDSPLGVTLLAFFRWLAHPRDQFSRATWETSPLSPIINAQGATWQSWNALLESIGYAAFLRHLRARMTERGIKLSDFHQRRFERWILSAATFDTTGGSLSDWINTMQSLTQKDNPPKDVIQVLTIHKSKGLEFDAVILPFDSGEDPAQEKNILYLEAYDQDGNIKAVLLPPGSKDLRNEWIPSQRTSLQPPPAEADQDGYDTPHPVADARQGGEPTPQERPNPLDPFIAQWKDTQYKENSNLLYVALTRAVRANYILVNSQISSQSKTHGGITLATVNALQALHENTHTPSPTETESSEGEEPSTLLLRMGTQQWHDDLPPLNASSPAEDEQRLPSPPRHRARKSPSQLADESPATPVQRDDVSLVALSAARARARRFGTEVHALLEQIQWWNPDAPPAWFRNPVSDAEQVAAAALNDPQVLQFFTPAAGVEAYNEQRLEAVTDTTWTSAIIDRLLLYPQEQRALILDYKTNRQSTGLKEFYRPQMQAYRKLVAKATGYPLNRISVALLHLNGQPDLLRYEESDWAAPAEQNPT